MTTRLIVTAGFVVAFAAGLIGGVQLRRALPPHPPSGPGPATRMGRHGWLAAELGLTAQQQEQMTRIWSDVARRGRGEHEERRRQLRKERDDAIAALIRQEDRAAYEQILKTYSDRMAALEQETRAAFQEAVEKTKQILTPQQREKYEAILKRNQWENRRAAERATSRPASDK